MTGTLSLAILSTWSSYKDRLCYAADGNPETDTVQNWIGPEMSFMIQTYALDHDVRIYAVQSIPNGLEILDKSNQKHYGDIVDRWFHLTFENVHDENEVRAKFAEHGLDPTVQIEDGAFMFWRYGDAHYRTISSPTDIPDDEEPN